MRVFTNAEALQILNRRADAPSGALPKHAAVVARFRHADHRAVARMWRDGVNERGEPLTAFEREALVERHCELFGRWPK